MQEWELWCVGEKPDDDNVTVPGRHPGPSAELYDLLAKACGAVSPLALEAKVFERQHAAALSTGQRPPQPSAVPRPDTAARAMGVSEAPKRASEPDAPSLYLAIRGGHADFIRYVLHRLPSAQLQARVLRVVVVHGIIPLDGG